GLIVSLTALPLVAWLGKGNLQNGYFYTMMVMGALSIVLFFICFGLTKERYSTDITANNQSSILDDLKTLLANKDWRILFTLNVVNLIAVLFKGGTTLYYVNNIMGRADLGSLLLTTTLASGVVGAMLSPFIFKNIDKVKGFKLSMALEAVLLIAMYFVPAGNVAAIFTLVIIINIIQLAATPLQWSMLSDIIDAEEKRSGKKLSGIVFSTNLFAIKLGIAIGGALVGYLLAWGDYVGGAAQQSASALQMIKLLFTLFPGVLVALLIVIMNRYSLDDKRLSHMAQESGR
ncbi:MFS transporter, partial [Klebsiella variicola]